MNEKQLIKLIKVLEKYPIELILVKHLILNGIDSEEKFLEFIKNQNLKRSYAVSLQNYFRDIQIGAIWDFDKIPTLLK